jgi:hypothetical protein
VLDDNEIMARNNGAEHPLLLQAHGGELVVHGQEDASFHVKDSGRVGIGTNSPRAKLEVRGDIQLGLAGDLFALGGLQSLRVLAGQVGDDGTYSAGSGFNSSRTTEGRYTVSFTSAYTVAPIVIACAVDASGQDNIVTVRNIDSDGFQIVARDATGSEAGDRQDTAFAFIALGPAS